MAVTHGKSSVLLLDGYDLTGMAQQADVMLSIDMHDATVFGSSAHVKAPGLRNGTITSELFFDDTVTTGSWDVLTAKYGSTTPATILFAPQGLTLGNRSLQIYALQALFSSKQVVSDLSKVTFNGEAEEDAVDWGVTLHALSAETVFPFSGTSVDNLAATANGGVGQVHVTAIAGTTKNAVYKIQHSTDNATWVDLVTFSAITTANSVLRTEVAAGTTIRRYLRITITDGGITTSVTGVVAFARR